MWQIALTPSPASQTRLDIAEWFGLLCESCISELKMATWHFFVQSHTVQNSTSSFFGCKISRDFGEIVSIPRSLLPSVPSSQLGKVPLTVENWNGSWLQNNGADFSCQNHLFGEKTIFEIMEDQRLQVFHVRRYRSQSCCLPSDHNFATASSHRGRGDRLGGGVLRCIPL